MKILIVEDEKRPREGLCTKLTSMYPGVQILPPQKDGASGMRIIQKEHPDIILTDICMPDIDGLEMISQILNNEYTPYIIIISGFSNFEYAQKALSLGVSEYLLKPYKLEDIQKKIDIALRKSAVKFSKPIETECLFEKDGVLLLRYHSCIDVAHLIQTVIVFLGKYSGNNLSIEHYFNSQKQMIAFTFTHSKNTILCTIPSRKEIEHRLSINFAGTVVGFFLTKDDIASNIYSISDFHCGHMFYPLKKIESLEGFKKWGIKDESSFVFNYEKYFNEPIYRNDRVAYEASIVFWIHSLTTSGIPSYTCGKKLISLLHKLNTTMLALYQNKETVFDVEATTATLKDILHPDQLASLLLDLFPKKTSENVEFTAKTKNSIIIKTLSIIENSIHEPLYLEEIAGTLQVSAEHVSRLFKEEMGVGFKSYVNRLKIDYAKSYIQLNTMDLDQVAHKLGYSSSRYFGKVFKKITGMTIKEFKKNL